MSNEAIHNTESRLFNQDSIGKVSVCNIIDCHDSANAESRNDAVADASVFRHCERKRSNL